MNILYLSFIVPYPVNRGDQRRIMVSLSSLCAKHDVTLICLSDERPGKAALAKLRQMCASVEIVRLSRWRKRLNQLAALMGPRPLRVSACRSLDLSRRVDHHLRSRSYDLIYAFDARMAPYLDPGAGPMTLLDFCDAYSIYYERAARVERNWLMKRVLRTESRRMRAYERELVAKTDACIICSDLDQQAVAGSAPRDNVHVIPNTIEVHDYEHAGSMVEPYSMIYLGNMGLKANVDAVQYFCSAVLPSVLKRVPQARLYIVGPGATAEIQALARQHEQIQLTGRVEDLTGFLSQRQVFVCPLRIGAGTRIKLLEAMAIGVPIVTTSLGCEGIALAPGRHAIVTDEPETFAEGVVRLLNDRGLREDLAAQAKHFVKAEHDTSIVTRRLDQLIDTLCPAGL